MSLSLRGRTFMETTLWSYSTNTQNPVKLVGPNRSLDLIMCIGKTTMFCYDVQVQVERQVKIDCLPGDHKSQNIQGDLVKIIRELQKAEEFKH